jgi:hypothetical protein
MDADSSVDLRRRVATETILLDASVVILNRCSTRFAAGSCDNIRDARRLFARCSPEEGPGWILAGHRHGRTR